MSDRITHVHVIQTCDLRIPRADYVRLRHELQEDLPEESLFDPDIPRAELGDIVWPKEVWWHGEGADAQGLISALENFDGFAELVVFYESGSTLGLRLQDHEVTRHRVRYTLVDVNP